MTNQDLNELIRNRRSIYPPEFTDKPISKEILTTILTNGTFAPNYKKTEPWRFKVLQGKAKTKLGLFLSNAYKGITPEEKFLEKKYLKIQEKANNSSAVIAICMQRDPEERLEEWEEFAAVAMAVQNMWLTATQHGIGTYWGSPKAIKKAHKVLTMAEGEKCFGFLFLGYVENAKRPSNRLPLDQRVDWME